MHHPLQHTAPPEPWPRRARLHFHLPDISNCVPVPHSRHRHNDMYTIGIEFVSYLPRETMTEQAKHEQQREMVCGR